MGGEQGHGTYPHGGVTLLVDKLVSNLLAHSVLVRLIVGAAQAGSVDEVPVF